METAFAFVMPQAFLLLGVLGGILAWDMKLRKQDRLNLVDAESRLKDAQAKLAELHNLNAQQMMQLTDKVSAHEHVIRSGMNDKAAIKRF